ncbi:hypothetical protein acdb102_21870 [Acidothermaceae bacterium B102]|nr:hypothetical protein acdb102_21870 [Acidothermaceae bacterium B102]
MIYTTTHEVRYGDIDRFGHVNHIKLLEFFESARNPFFRDMADFEGLPNVLDVAGFVVVQLKATFHRPVDKLAIAVEVRTSVERLGDSSVTMRYELWHDTALRVTATTVLVFVANGKGDPMSPLRREYMLRHLDGDNSDALNPTAREPTTPDKAK